MRSIMPTNLAYIESRRTTDLTFKQWDYHRIRWRAGSSTTAGRRATASRSRSPNEYLPALDLLPYAGGAKASRWMVPANTRLSTPEMVAILGTRRSRSSSHARGSSSTRARYAPRCRRCGRSCAPTVPPTACSVGTTRSPASTRARCRSRRRRRHGRHHVHLGHDRPAERWCSSGTATSR